MHMNDTSHAVDSRLSSNLGIQVYGLAAIALGVIGLVWGDFATIWQPIQALGNVPNREALAYTAAVSLLSGGAALLWRRTAKAGVVLLAVLYFIFALFWLPRQFFMGSQNGSGRPFLLWDLRAFIRVGTLLRCFTDG